MLIFAYVEIWTNFNFAFGCPISSTTVWLSYLCQNQLSIYMWVYFWTLFCSISSMDLYNQKRLIQLSKKTKELLLKGVPGMKLLGLEELLNKHWEAERHGTVTYVEFTNFKIRPCKVCRVVWRGPPALRLLAITEWSTLQGAWGVWTGCGGGVCPYSTVKECLGGTLLCIPQGILFKPGLQPLLIFLAFSTWTGLLEGRHHTLTHYSERRGR